MGHDRMIYTITIHLLPDRTDPADLADALQSIAADLRDEGERQGGPLLVWGENAGTYRIEQGVTHA